tara:strand:- start:677 stop:1006 length:330 start_codon:yes stop_codon:yes gene_type:complete
MIQINKIKINHNDLGDIEIHNHLTEEANGLIGVKASDYCNYSFYFANIKLNENGTITIKNLRVIKSERVNVGFYEIKGTSKNYVDIYKNLSINKEIVCYPKSIISIFYD